MNSLQELNGWGTTYRTFNDSRATSITFSSVVNQTLNFFNGETSGNAPVGCNITAAASVPSNCTFTITTGRSDNNVYFTWTDLPYNCTVTNPTPGTWVVTGPFTVGVWNRIRSPQINWITGFGSSTTLTSTINCGGSYTRSWTTAVTWAVDVTSTYEYTEDTAFVLDFTINDSDLGNYTIQINQIYPSQSSNPGRFGFDSPSSFPPPWEAWGNNFSAVKTREQWNTGELWYQPPVDYTGPITLAYTQIKSTGNVVQANAWQILSTCVSSDLDYLLVQNYNYTENTPVDLTAKLSDNAPIGEAIYTININQTTPSQLTNPGRFSDNSGVLPGGSVGGIKTFPWGQDYSYVGNGIPQTSSSYLGPTYNPPMDYTGPIVLKYTQVKNVDGVNYEEANELVMNITNTGSIDGLHIPGSLTSGYATSSSTGVNLLGINANRFYLNDGNVSPTNYRVTATIISGNGRFNSFQNPTTTVIDYASTEALNNGTLSIVSNDSTSGTVRITIERTSPVYRSFCSDYEISYTLTTPALGTAMEGGWYAGNYSRTGSGANTHILIASAHFYTTTGSPNYATWAFNTRTGYTLPTTANNYYYGATNTTILSSWGTGSVNTAEYGLGNPVLTVVGIPPAKWAQFLDYNQGFNPGNGYVDWYLPSANEMYLVRSRIPSKLPSTLVRRTDYTTVTAQWWTSTVSSGNVNYINGSGAISSTTAATGGESFGFIGVRSKALPIQG